MKNDPRRAHAGSVNITVIIALILALFGGGAILLLSQTDAASTDSQISKIKESKGELRASLKLIAIEVHKTFDPISFTGVEIPAEEILNDEKLWAEYVAQAPSIEVRYDGDNMLTVERFSHVTLEGKWNAKLETFVADTMTTKCPTRYEGSAQPPEPGKANPLSLGSDANAAPSR